MAYYQNGEALLTKQPRGLKGELDLHQRMSPIRSPLFLAHASGDGETQPRPDDTQPFRYGRWAFVMSGTDELFTSIDQVLIDALPPFVRRNIHGRTGCELFFHLIITFLNDAGNLTDPHVGGADAARALLAAAAYVRKLVTASAAMDPAEAPPNKYACLMSNGQFVVGLQHGVPIALARRSDYTKINEPGSDKVVSYPHLKSVVVVSRADCEQLGQGWETIQPKRALIVEKTLDISYQTE